MKINLLTDAPKHNLALMKISTWHKMQGDDVLYNLPIFGGDYRYASILYEKTKIAADEYGGPANPGSCLPDEIESMVPDYDLYPIDYSLGYTFRPCYNSCAFCKVPKMDHPDTKHHSIWEFHTSRFKKICLLNNNTFQDPQWKETFQEIWDAKLSVIDENGYDLRLIDDEKADALHRTKWASLIHFAWDRMQDESIIVHGLEILKRNKIKGSVYVLVGFDTTEKQDLHRCQKIIENGQTPYIMPFNGSKKERRFKRFIDSFMWRKYKTLATAWGEYA